MLLSVITINRNNQAGLKKTLESTVSQSFKDFEHIVIDGASTDNSVDIIRQYEQRTTLNWVSEPDKGIYNAMNKGIARAQGEYIMILNSGDCLTANHVLSDMAEQLQKKGNPDILYGNITKVWPDGRKLRQQRHDEDFTMFSFYRGTLDPDGTLIRRSLFETFGPFDESMRICSDWAWFMKTIVFGQTKAVHADVDTIYFDMTGISESDGKNQNIIREERRNTLQKSLPPLVLADYDRYSDDIVMTQRLHRHPWAFRLTRLLERILFKLEKHRK